MIVIIVPTILFLLLLVAAFAIIRLIGKVRELERDNGDLRRAVRLGRLK